MRREGYHNYNEIFTRKDYDFILNKMTGKKKQQFFFINPLTPDAEKIMILTLLQKEILLRLVLEKATL